MNYYADFEDWELEQRRDALSSMIESFAKSDHISPRSLEKVRRYMAELSVVEFILDGPRQLVISYNK